MTQNIIQLPLAFAERDINENFERDFIQGGKAYFSEHRVLEVKNTTKEGDASVGLQARVRGSVREPYQLRITLKKRGRGGILIDSSCNCETGFRCKHAVAVLLEVLERNREGEAGADVAEAGSEAGNAVDNVAVRQTPVAKSETRPVKPPTPWLKLVRYVSRPPFGVKVSAPDKESVRYAGLLHAIYDGVSINPATDPDMVREARGDNIIFIPRDLAAEAAQAQRLAGVPGLQRIAFYGKDGFAEQTAFAFPTGGETRYQWFGFLQDVVPQLRREGWQVDLSPEFAQAFRFAETDMDSLEGDIRNGEGGAWWFSLDLGIMVEGARVQLLPLLVQAIARLKNQTGAGRNANSPASIEALSVNGKIYADLPDGRSVALPFDRLRTILGTLVELFDSTPLNKDGTLSVSLDLAGALTRIQDSTKMRWLGGKRLRQLMDKLQHFDGIAEVDVPPGLVADLRGYQKQGLAWLQFLREYELGGILADDMGLGKTVQTLAHLLVEKNAGRLDRPCLVICPTSLIPNWQDEAAKFAPTLKVVALHGKDRLDRFAEMRGADVVLSTYALLPRDEAVLMPIEWHLVVLDEAQAIKNPTSIVTQLVCELKSRHRLCLTGTPIENHLGEAWSHFSFLLPGMLGDHKQFNRLFRNPIEKGDNPERKALLVRRLKPFILRRTKAEVASELPPKTEILHYVEMEPPQRDLYETLRLTMHDKVQEAVAAKGFNRSHIVILDALLKLRQVCCDPRLVKLEAARKVIASAKLVSLLEMVPKLIEEGRKILIFSQFTSMLDLIRPEMAKANIPYVEIRGDTVDRKTPVTQFQNGDVPVFLISLKAGGTGLNLTAADTVIHFDPWWNPAVEAQATDRAHRIGQDKPVFVYKFIVRGTVEERILEMQQKKRDIAAAILDENSSTTAALTQEDLTFLFKES